VKNGVVLTDDADEVIGFVPNKRLELILPDGVAEE